MQVEAALASGGAATVAGALLRSAAETCPRQLLRAAATALRALLGSGAHGQAARGAVVHTLSAPDFPGALNMGQRSRLFGTALRVNAVCEVWQVGV